MRQDGGRPQLDNRENTARIRGISIDNNELSQEIPWWDLPESGVKDGFGECSEPVGNSLRAFEPDSSTVP